MSEWVYFLGERTRGDLIKIGHTKGATAGGRLASINANPAHRLAKQEFVFLVAMHGSQSDERTLHRLFHHLHATGEYFRAEPELVEYVAWLRSCWWAFIDVHDGPQPDKHKHLDEWCPGPGRRIPPPIRDDTKMFQDYEAAARDLGGTPFDWMPDPRVSFQDYFTPPEIVEAARQAMGGIDLDAASHPAANWKLRIPKYFTSTFSAFENPWHGRVWLNPPYGNNEPWFREIVRWVSSGDVTQVCMISPQWAFQTQVATETVMRLATAKVELVPTPKFWGNEDPTATGSNHPHSIIYIGPRPDRFKAAFRPFGNVADLNGDSGE